MKKIIVALVVLVALFSMVGCGNKNEVGDSGAESVTINVVGSTSVTPAVELIAKEYESVNPDVKIDIQGIGSTAGVNATNDSTADIGMASRNLKESEGEYGLTEYVLAYDGIAVVTHPSNPVGNLDKDTITAIFKGEITNWKEVGGEDATIIVISREEGSGTRGAFDEIMNLEEKNDAGDAYSMIVDDAIIADGNGSVKANVASKDLAIGYVSLSYIDDSVQTLMIDGVAPSVDNVINGTYKISRPFLLLTKGDLTQEVQAFLDYALGSEGQEFMKSKWVPAN